MTNKINSIDVSECEFLECGMCNAQRNCDGYTGIECKYDNESCYYRQLKRLQEENKKLKNKNNDLIEVIASGNIDIAILQKENEGLKSLNDFNVQKIEVLQEENEELKIYIQKMDKPEIKTIDSEIALKNIELQQENEKIKKQYNCYACGNCNGKEDYINLEKHHKGLRKQFDKFVKRNNTLSIKIEELEKENEKLKEDLKGETEQAQKWYQLETDKHFLALKFCKTLEEIRKEANRLLYEENPIYGYNNSNHFEILAKYVLAKINEALNDRD